MKRSILTSSPFPQPSVRRPPRFGVLPSLGPTPSSHAASAAHLRPGDPVGTSAKAVTGVGCRGTQVLVQPALDVGSPQVANTHIYSIVHEASSPGGLGFWAPLPCSSALGTITAKRKAEGGRKAQSILAPQAIPVVREHSEQAGRRGAAIGDQASPGGRGVIFIPQQAGLHWSAWDDPMADRGG